MTVRQLRSLVWMYEPPVPGVAPSLETMARTGGNLFAAGAVMSLLVAVLPHDPGANELGYHVVALASACIALLMRLRAGRLPSWVLQLLLAAGTALISLDIWFSGEGHGGPAADNEMLYVWIALYGAYFFSRMETVLQIAFIALSYAIVLGLAAPGSIFVTRWLETVGTLAVAAVLVHQLKDRLAGLVSRLADAARTDPLTGLHNRRGFEELIAPETERARRYESPLTVLVGDLDHFKRLNDRCGHQAGDGALERIGRLLDDGKRQIDTAARTGGEEFALILPETDPREAYLIAERLRAAVQTEFADSLVPLTISFGLAAYPDHGEVSEELVAAADRALYAAKELGRNRSVIYSDQIEALPAASMDPSNRSAMHVATIISLAEALDLRDAGTADHSQTVGRYSELTARALGLDPRRVARVRLAGVLHDVGKVGLPDSVLRKPGPLTDEQWAEVRRHPEIGARILSSGEFDDIRPWVLAHHERPDGKGYPAGLAGGEIPLEARIVAVADAYEAMTADRVYRPAPGVEVAREQLLSGAGTQFDGRVVEAFLAAVRVQEDALSV